MKKKKKKLESDLRCLECRETCSHAKDCFIYGDDAPHVHLAGGHKEYGLCEPCLEKFYLRHRPMQKDGTYKWLKKCKQRCGFCKLMEML